MFKYILLWPVASVFVYILCNWLIINYYQIPDFTWKMSFGAGAGICLLFMLIGSSKSK